jgi:hypothetical protein
MILDFGIRNEKQACSAKEFKLRNDRRPGMKVIQLSVFLGNEEGRLSEVMSALAKADINIRALSLADTADFGVLRMIVDRPNEAVTALKKSDIIVKTTDIIAVEVEDAPGGLSKVLNVFKHGKINIEYMYAFVEKNNDNAVLVFRVEAIDEVIGKLKESDVKILDSAEVYGI